MGVERPGRDRSALHRRRALFHGAVQRALARRQEIVAKWLDRKDDPGGWAFEWQPLLDTPELAIITGTTTYSAPPLVYSNLWVLRLADDGRCREFTEWWMEHKRE